MIGVFKKFGFSVFEGIDVNIEEFEICVYLFYIDVFVSLEGIIFEYMEVFRK